ncbi:hypothetical protein [Aquitalea sp. ASV11]|uniref:hypothetical protein n=1 Tax=Aquitalea sp. ASV11 TaxID=2795103 RepID=UPI0018EA9235|nr:hypothetical protein [Aquitalea sp. ASV11]
MDGYAQFQLAKQALAQQVAARQATQPESLTAARPPASPALHSTAALQAQVLRPHQLEAIAQLGAALHSLVPLLATIDTQLVLHGIKASNMALAQIAAGRLYHELAETVALSRWASHRLQAGAVPATPTVAAAENLPAQRVA